MSLVNSLSSATPKWATQCTLALGTAYSALVFAQQHGYIDVLPVDPALKAKIQTIVAAVVGIGAILLMKQTPTTPVPETPM